MKLEKNQKKVYQEIRKELRKDRAKVAVAPITEFGLLEMTRQRIRLSLVDSMSQECPSCNGSGRIISKETLITRIEHWLRRHQASSRSLRLNLALHPENAHFLKVEKKQVIRGLMWQNFIHLKVDESPDIALDEFKFLTRGNRKDITNEIHLD